jgi:hypothetical protein
VRKLDDDDDDDDDDCKDDDDDDDDDDDSSYDLTPCSQIQHIIALDRLRPAVTSTRLHFRHYSIFFLSIPLTVSLSAL